MSKLGRKGETFYCLYNPQYFLKKELRKSQFSRVSQCFKYIVYSDVLPDLNVSLAGY